MVKKTYGSLFYENDQWLIKELNPHVTIRFKALFPKIAITDRPPFILPDTSDIAADLDWFCDRYPLLMDDKVYNRLKIKKKIYEQKIVSFENILSDDYKPPKVFLCGNAELRDYQSKAVELILKNKFLFLGDDLGLGKTITGVGILVSEGTIPAFIVVPTHLMEHWSEKIQEFTNLRVHKVKGTTPYKLPIADVYIIKYSCLPGWIDMFSSMSYKTVIFDEVHYLRRAESQRYIAAAEIAKYAEIKLGLSATPIFNYGEEIYNILDVLNPEGLGARDSFLREWTNHNKVVKDANALGTFLRDNFMFLRRRPEEVGIELPQLNKIVQNVDFDQKTVKNAESLMKQLAQKVLSGSFTEQGQAARELDMYARKITGIAKARAVAEYVKILLDNDRPVLLVGWHRDCFSAGTKILMYNGLSKNVEDIIIGDQVMGPDAQPRNVKHLITGKGKMFKITPKKGEQWFCSENHILTVKKYKKGEQIVENIKASEFFNKTERQKRNYSLFRAEALEFDKKEIIEPWFLGYWLGDGASSLADLRISSNDIEVENKVNELANKYNFRIKKWKNLGASGISKCHQYCLSTYNREKNIIKEYFRSLNLHKNKHIPNSVKTSSLSCRKQLLAGLLDSDGHMYPNGCGADYTSVTKRLADDVAWICRSLGLAAYVYKKTISACGYQSKNGNKDYYSVSISGDLTDIPTIIKRKKASKRTINKNVLHVGFTIEESAVDNFYGFETDGDHLFLLDDFTVVHNCYEIWEQALKEYAPVFYTGSESPKQKDENAKQFMKDENTKLMIISLASGEGLDGLQFKSADIVFGELAWSPAVHEQLIGRLNRKGQENQVTAHFLVSDSGSDPLIIELLGLKASQSRKIVDPTVQVETVVQDTSRMKMLAQHLLDKKEAPKELEEL